MKKAAVAVAVLLVSAGVVDVLLVCYQLGWANGLLFCAHDPGKFAFHIFILPLAMGVVLARFPVVLVASVWKEKGRRLPAIAIAAIVTAFCLTYSVYDTIQGFQSRLITGPDVRDRALAQKVFEFAKTLRKRILDKDDVNKDDRGALKPDGRKEFEKLISDLGLAERSIWKHGSVCLLWSGLLTNLGLLSAGLLMWTVFLPLVAHKLPYNRTPIAQAIILMSLWIPLRIYSEWYGSFFHLDPGDYPPFILAITAILAAFILLFLPGEREKPGVPTVVAAVLTVLANLAAICVPGLAEWFAESVAKLQWFSLASWYFLIVLMFAGVAWILLASGDSTRRAREPAGAGGA